MFDPLRWRPWSHAWSFRVGWFRLLGVGIAWIDHRHYHPLFSERYAGQYNIPRKRRLHLGPWCIRLTTWVRP